MLHSFECLNCLHLSEVYIFLSTVLNSAFVLIVLPEGPRKGQAASRSTISRCIHQLISQAYGIKNEIPPFPIIKPPVVSVLPELLSIERKFEMLLHLLSSAR